MARRQPTRDLVREQLGSTGTPAADIAPVEDEDSHYLVSAATRRCSDASAAGRARKSSRRATTGSAGHMVNEPKILDHADLIVLARETSSAV
jgi:hypothetical protein